jgi:glycosyltransferase involved in cell wall biosynthesis
VSAGAARERLIVIGPTPPPFHGVSVMTTHLLRALEEEGRVAAHLNTADARGVHNAGRLDLGNAWLGLRHSAEFLRLLVRHRSASVYVPISQNRLGLLRDAVFLVAARVAGRRRYVHLHGGHFSRFYRSADPLTRIVARLAVGGAHQAWVLTPGLRGMFDGLLAPGRVAVLENVVDDPGVDRGEDPGGADAPLRVLFLSNLVTEKGPLDLLAALARMGPAGRGVQVRLVGEAEKHVEAEVEAAGQALARQGVQVEQFGALTGADKLRQLAWANTFALPTYYPLEGQPLVLLEAMAAGLAIVTTRHAGIPDTVRDGEEALLVEAGDTDALAEALTNLSADPELRAGLGRRARGRWEARYAPERYVDDLRALLDGRPVNAAAGPAEARTRSTASTPTAD